MMNDNYQIRILASNEIHIIRRLSDEIWRKVYPSIISMEQIEFMLELIYNEDALKKQINELGHTFLLIIKNDEPIGYASFSLKDVGEQGRYRLHKLYLQPDQHGKGLGKSLLNKIIEMILPSGAQSIELNVNKYNPTLGFYKKLGFSIISEEVIYIGQGYVMDDYVMELSPLKYPL